MGILLSVVLAAGLIGPLDHTVVTPAWLEPNLDDPNIVVVEIGSGPEVDHPHIPGARFVPLEAIVAAGWPPDELPPVEQLRKAFGNAGVGDNGRIILYSTNPLYATRAWFTLDTLGQGYRAAILDGGFQRWTEEKRPVMTRRVAHLAKTFTAYPDPTRVVTLAEVRSAADQHTALLIDARPGFEFHGFRRGVNVARRGHIPGAACDPAAANLTPDGSFLSPERLKAKFTQLAGSTDRRVIVYCRTGMEASMPYFVLRSLGYDVALYDGSYAEWSRDKTTRVARLSNRR